MKFLLLFFSFNAISALAPFYHSVKEIEDLMNRPELVNTLGVDKQITSIQYVEKKWIVKSGNCGVEVESKLKDTQMPGSPNFEFKFGKLICN